MASLQILSRTFSLFFISLFLSLSAFAAPIDLNLKIEFQEIQRGKPKLKLRLSNDSPYQIERVMGNYPWSNGISGIQMFAFWDDADRTELPQLYSVGHGTVFMKPKTSLDGEIDLAATFPTLQNVRGHRNVIVFWAYRLSSIKSKDNEVDFENQFGGMIVVPRLGSKHIVAAPADIDLKIAFQEDEIGKPRLLVDLTNNSSYQLDALVSNPPWINGTSGIQLFAYLDDFTGRELTQSVSGEHSPISMTPKARREGTIDLSKTFPKLHMVRDIRDVLVFWTYKLSGIQGNTNTADFENRFGGMINIPRYEKK